MLKTILSACLTSVRAGREIMQEIFLTLKGKAEKEKRLDYLIHVRRPEVVEKLKAAREYGDLSENAEYDAAREEQGRVESEIALIEETLRVAKIVDASACKSKTVSVGAKVLVLDVEFDEEIEYTIVGAIESNPDKNMISNVSPIGKALIGKKKGDTVFVETPGGKLEMKVLDVKY